MLHNDGVDLGEVDNITLVHMCAGPGKYLFRGDEAFALECVNDGMDRLHAADRFQRGDQFRSVFDEMAYNSKSARSV